MTGPTQRPPTDPTPGRPADQASAGEPPAPGTGPAERNPRVRAMRAIAASAMFWLYGMFLLVGATKDVFERAERYAVEKQAAWSSHPGAGSVAIVRITESDYRSLFGGRSPLDPQRLRTLIERVAQGGPSVIGVDIDTSDPSMRPLADLHCGRCTIVWARDARAQRDGRLVPQGVLGTPSAPRGATDGLVVLFESPGDKVTRRYSRAIETTAGVLPTLPAEVAAHQDVELASRRLDTEPMNILYREAPRFTIPSSVVLADGFDWRDRIGGRIVLIGGSYDRDKHYTPIGYVDGVEVLAHAIETELAGGGTTRPHVGGIVLLGIVEWVLLAVLFQRMVWWQAGLAALAIVALLAPVLWWLGLFVYWPPSIYLMVGVFFERLQKYFRLGKGYVIDRMSSLVVNRLPGGGRRR